MYQYRALFIIYNLTNDLTRHSELHEDAILSVETCSSMLFVIVVFDIIMQSLVRL